MSQPCGMYELVVDLRGEIVAAGSGLAALCRTDASELVGRPVTQFLRGPGMTVTPGHTARITLKRAGREDLNGLALRHIDGDRIRMVIIPDKDEGLPTPGATDRAPPRLREIERLVDQVIRAIHNPLTGIIGFSALAHLAPTPHRRRYYLDQVATQAQRCRRLVESLDAGTREVTPFPTTIDAADRLGRALSALRLELEGHGISVEMSLPSQALWVEFDPKMLDDIFIALIHRGTLGMRKAYRAREVAIRAQVGGDGLVLVSLAFGGADVLSPLLSRRFTLESATHNASSTLSDIELKLAYEQLRQQGAALSITDSPDGESVFLGLTLPRGKAPRHTDQTRTPVPLDILAIDDDAMMGELYAELLGVSGHAVTSVRSLQSAREALRSQRFDAVIAEFFFNDGVFSELWAEAASNHPELSERIVIITSDRANPRVREWLARGSTPVLQKPFTTQALLAEVAALTL
ncbi:MAG: CheY-like chemotaxis protein [Myxococcota bacterium]|jgi:CheY-like chemotaxis protein